MPGECPSCAARSAAPLFRTTDRRYGLGGEYDVVRCPCGLVRTEPQPADPSVVYPQGSYYSYQPPQLPQGSEMDAIRAFYGRANGGGLKRRVVRKLRLARITALPPGPPGKILDVGCGSGAALLALAEVGWEPYGIEPSAPAVEAGYKSGLTNLRVGELPDARYRDGQFDAVRFAHVLEHTRNPVEQLAEARRILKPGGTLFVSVPNFASLLSRRARGHWFGLDVPRHLLHFDAESLHAVAESAGFEHIRVKNRSTGTSILGTRALRKGRDSITAGRGERVGAEIAAALLDALHLGDGLEMVASRPSEVTPPRTATPPPARRLPLPTA